MKKQKLNINEEISKALVYLGESKSYVFGAILVFILGAIVAIYSPNSFSFFNDMIKEIVLKIQGLNSFELVLFIFKNNIIGAFLGIVLGILLGIFPFINCLANGALLGYVLRKSVEAGGIGEIWRLLPHGVFELPAIFISFGLGIKLGGFILFRKGEKIKELKKRFFNSIRVFVFVVVPLLIIAAIIEGVLIGVLK